MYMYHIYKPTRPTTFPPLLICMHPWVLGKTNFVLIIYLTKFLNLLQLYGHYCDLKVLQTGVILMIYLIAIIFVTSHYVNFP